MDRTINAKDLRHSLAEVVQRARAGDRYVVLYRSRPAFRIVPIEPEADETDLPPLEDDPMFGALAKGNSKGRQKLTDDEIIYGTKR